MIMLFKVHGAPKSRLIRLIIIQRNNAVYVQVREHAARAVGDLEGRCRGVTAEHSGCFLDPRGGGPVPEQCRRTADYRRYNDNDGQPQGIPMRRRLVRWYVFPSLSARFLHHSTGKQQYSSVNNEKRQLASFFFFLHFFMRIERVLMILLNIIWKKKKKSNFRPSSLALCVLCVQTRTRIALPLRVRLQAAQLAAVRCETVAATSTCGSSWRNCYRARASTVPAYVGWIAARGSSRSRTRCEWHGSGASARTGPPWTTTSSAAVSVSTTRRASWRRRSAARDWCTSSVIPTVCEEFLLPLFLLFPKSPFQTPSSRARAHACDSSERMTSGRGAHEEIER